MLYMFKPYLGNCSNLTNIFQRVIFDPTLNSWEFSPIFLDHLEVGDVPWLNAERRGSRGRPVDGEELIGDGRYWKTINTQNADDIQIMLSQFFARAYVCTYIIYDTTSRYFHIASLIEFCVFLLVAAFSKPTNNQIPPVVNDPRPTQSADSAVRDLNGWVLFWFYFYT